MPSLLIRNARVAGDDGTAYEADVYCQDGRIVRIEGALDLAADEALDAAGLLLLPGVIDPQVHFREPGHEHKEDLGSGSRAAAAGGVTSFLEMPNTRPPTTTQAALDDKLARAARKCVVNYGFFIGATADNLDEVNRAAPVCGIKVFMGSSTGSLLLDREEDLERLFAHGSRLIAVHAEDEARIRARRAQYAHRTDPAAHSEMRDNECARLATARALALARKHRRRLHILHLSTREEAEMLRRHKPAWVTAEVVPQHLLLNAGDYERLGTLAQMNPPLRSPEDNAALWAALHDGVIDFIATDHAPHTLEEKRAGFPAAPSGMPGVETSLPLMLTEMRAGRCSLAQVQQWMSRGPAAAYRIANKGRIAPGYDADLVLVDIDSYRPVRNEALHTRAGWSPFAGRELTGWPVYTIVGARVVYERGHIREGVHGKPLQFPSDE